MVACQLGNLYLLMAFMGLAILNTTSEAKVVRAYLFVLWLGDIGHVGFTVYGLGMDRIAEPLEWNAVTMGNITFTVGWPRPREDERDGALTYCFPGLPILDAFCILPRLVRGRQVSGSAFKEKDLGPGWARLVATESVKCIAMIAEAGR